MALHYLSGIGDDYLGLDEISAPVRSAAAARNREQFLARKAALRARMELKKAAQLEERARRKINQANAATQTAATLSMDEFGRPKRGGGGGSGKAARQEARQQRRQAQQAKKAAKVQARTAKRAAAQAQRAAKAAQRQATRTAKQATRTANRGQRSANKAAVRTQRVTQRATRRAVPMPTRRRTALPEAPMNEEMDVPMEEPMEAEEEIMDEGGEAPEEYEEMEAEEIEPDYEAEEIGMNYLGMDEIGAGAGKKKRQAKKAARKTKRAAKKTTRQTKRTERGGSVVKKVAAAPMRAAFMLLMKTNGLKMRTKLRAAWKKDRAAVISKIVNRFGFKLSNFLTELNRKESERLSGFGEPVSISAAIISATPVITAALALFKSLKVPTNDIEQEIKEVKEKESGGGMGKMLAIGGAALLGFALLNNKSSSTN